MSDLLFTLNAVAPVFLTILLGYVLGHVGWMNEDFTKRASKIVFYVAIPIAIVIQMEGSDLRDSTVLSGALVFCGVTLLIFVLAAFVSQGAVSRASRGAFVQGSFRGNLVIVGLPVLVRSLGDDAFAHALIVIAFAMPLYNLLAVVALTVGAQGSGLATLGRRVVLNPLILAIVLGIAVSLSGIHLPDVVSRTGSYLGQMAFPLALLCVGAGMSQGGLRSRWRPALLAAVLKCVVTPLAVILIAGAFDVSGEVIALLAILAATPTAAISFIMAQAMDADHELAGAIVLSTIVASIVSMSATIFILRSTGLV